jgi:hypothetical protein
VYPRFGNDRNLVTRERVSQAVLSVLWQRFLMYGWIGRMVSIVVVLYASGWVLGNLGNEYRCPTAQLGGPVRAGVAVDRVGHPRGLAELHCPASAVSPRSDDRHINYPRISIFLDHVLHCIRALLPFPYYL